MDDRKLLAKFFLAFLICLIARVAVAGQESAPAPADWKKEGYKAGMAEFPKDEGSHPDNRMEWNYCNLHLTDENDRRYSLWVSYYVTFNARFIAFSDEDAGTFVSEVVMGLTTSKPGRRDLTHKSAYGTDRWKQAPGKPFVYLMHIEFKDIVLNVTMDAVKPPLPLELDARAEYDEKEFSYYYSLPRMAVEGTLETGGVKHKVRGIAWEDHQWGDFSLAVISLGIGHEWFSIQVNSPDGGNPTEIICYQLFTTEHRVNLPVFTMMRPDGSLFDTKDFTIERLAYYKHEDEYLAAKWRILEPENQIDLTLTPVVENQMLFPPMFKPFREGAVRVEGTIGGAHYSGAGFAEAFKRYSKPELKIISPSEGDSLKGAAEVRWQVPADEAQTLIYSVDYSGDGGKTFKPLAAGLKNNLYEWNLSGLPTGGKYLVRVTGRSPDGTFQSEAVSGIFVVATE